MAGHIVEYDETEDESQSWAKCSCGQKSFRKPGPASKNTAALDQWAEAHIDSNS
jgi:hypothetical protein